MYQIKSRIWIEGEKGIFLGEGRIQLLKAIGTHGYLSKAAKSLNMSCKKAWNLIDAINKSSQKPLVIKSTGGSGGGGTLVTAYGKLKIEQFDSLKKNCWEFMNSQNELFED